MSAGDGLAQIIKERARAVARGVRAVREDIHSHPELRFQEKRTGELCARELEKLGIDVRRGVGGTGVVGLLRGSGTAAPSPSKNPGLRAGGRQSAGSQRRGGNPGPGDAPTVAFRAEMDALPMDDLCGRLYQSKNKGVAHLCGHDGHVAALLGAARVLAGLRDRIPGNVKFFFEPAEENAPPGEISGAQAMLRDGAFEDPAPSAVFGAHFYPDWPAGSIALRVGSAFAGNDAVKLTIIGKESHTAVPHTGVDALLVAGHVITGLQSLASQFDIGEAVSMHFSTISGGRAANLIAERVEMAGTFRISDESLREEMPGRFERMVKGVCDAFGARYDLEYRLRNLPPVVSAKREVEIMRAALHEVLGPDRTIEMRHPRLAGDTMQNWLARAPGVFFMVGTANEDPSTQWPSHHQRFDIAPETWPAAVAGIAMTAIRYLEAAQAGGWSAASPRGRSLRRAQDSVLRGPQDNASGRRPAPVKG